MYISVALITSIVGSELSIFQKHFFASRPRRALIIDGNSRNGEYACRKIGLFGDKNPICDCSLSNEMPITDQII